MTTAAVEKSKEIASASFPALGSEFQVTVTDPSRLDGVLGYVHACVEAVDLALSRFRPDSELARLERCGGREHSVSPLFFEALELALRAARETDGWFDPTVRGAVEAAGYDRSIELIESEGPGPARASGSSTSGLWRGIRLDQSCRRVTLPDGARLDFGGIGKGFVVDLTLRAFVGAGLGVLINAGGDLGVVGPPPGDGWLCGVAAAAGAPTETTLLIRSGALATSGLGRRQWQRDGERLHHLIDPTTGRPAASPWRLVSVIAPSCIAAEVAAKVGFLRGEEGPDWVEARGLAGRFVALDGRVVTAGGWPTEPKEH